MLESIVQIEIKRSIDDALGGAYRLPRSAAVGSRMGSSVTKSCRDERHVPVASGGIWTMVRLSRRWKRGAYCSAVRTYAHWVVTLLTAILGTAAMSPITAAGRNGQRWQEGLVTVGFVTVGITIVAASILVLSRLRRTPMS